jgi:hypothetical protein
MQASVALFTALREVKSESDKADLEIRRVGIKRSIQEITTWGVELGTWMATNSSVFECFGCSANSK